MDKQELRHEMKRQLKTIHQTQDQTDQNQSIYESLWNHEMWKNHATLGLTVSTPLELDTTPLIQRAWEDAKQVAVPKCHPADKHLIFHSLTSFDQLEFVYFGLLEPIPSLTSIMPSNDLEVVVVPGLCFDQRGFRIGFGGGYYDRFLISFKGIKIGLAYDFQVLDNLPIESHDIPVDWVFTPTQIIECTKRRGDCS